MPSLQRPRYPTPRHFRRHVLTNRVGRHGKRDGSHARCAPLNHGLHVLPARVHRFFKRDRGMRWSVIDAAGRKRWRSPRTVAHPLWTPRQQVEFTVAQITISPFTRPGVNSIRFHTISLHFCLCFVRPMFRLDLFSFWPLGTPPTPQYR